MADTNAYQSGDKVDLLFHIAGTHDKTEWRCGYVVDYVTTAEDRPYRVKVVNLTWACAPECVRRSA